MTVFAGDIIFADDINEIDDGTLNKPIGRLVAASTQSIPNGLAATAITFSAEEIDTDGFHDNSTNNTRVTPSVPGYYRFSGTVFMGSSMAGVTNAQSHIRKNGTTPLAPASRTPGQTAFSTNFSSTCIQQMNGTTDYVELIMMHNATAAALTSQSGQLSSVLEWEFLRGL